ncbi:hypothetical protein O181_045582 [Austropuccinia psidii MF-1]|uniref:DNA-directed RNA polymerase III subunit RPC6 n=1 Tax=Austropuccinia psidii MF-1 TaxID=1389203 RepID=A0A9Q3DPN3_9BASI|nr:hypothetical protein [Austropuccinia psidii MF-1]
MASSSTAAQSQAGNKISKEEKELFLKCLQADQRTLSHEELQAAMPNLDVIEKMNIANSLIARGMIQVKRLQNELFYTAVDKNQQKVNSSMSAEEKLVYDNIANSGNTGIWTKTLKIRTNIHQTNITKCLKALENKNLIKAVKSVKFPTRKIYMLSELQPSIELSGGPWYTDNELDTEFIAVLLQGIHKCLLDRSYPSASPSSADPSKSLLYPTSHTAYLPTTVHDVLSYLKQSQIIQEGTDLNSEHIITLLDVLLFDGAIERITVGRAKCEGYDDFDEEIKEESAAEDDENGDYNSSHKRQSSFHSAPGAKKRKSNSGKQLRFDDGLEAGLDDMENEDVKPALKTKRRIPDNEAFVYRALRPFQAQTGYEAQLDGDRMADFIPDPPNVSGFFDMPCGHCPSFDFCASKGKAWQFKGLTTLGADPGNQQGKLPRIGLAGIGAGFGAVGGLGAAGGVAPVNPADCLYFTEWLDF